MTEAVVALRVYVSGRVQGVGFRDECRRVARKAGLNGWVRNLADGRVEAWLEGDKTAVEQVAAWCQRGPSWTEVTGIEVSDQTPRGGDRFEVR